MRTDEIKIRLNEEGELVNSKGEVVSLETFFFATGKEREFVVIRLNEKDKVRKSKYKLIMEGQLISTEEYERIMVKIKTFTTHKFGNEIAEKSEELRCFWKDWKFYAPLNKRKVAQTLLDELISGISRKDAILLFGQPDQQNKNSITYNIGITKSADLRLYFVNDKYVNPIEVNKVRLNEKNELVNQKDELVAIKVHFPRNKILLIRLDKKDKSIMGGVFLSRKEYEKIRPKIKTLTVQKFGSEMAEISEKFREISEINDYRDKNKLAKSLSKKLVFGTSKKDIILLLGQPVYQNEKFITYYAVPFSIGLRFYFENDKYVKPTITNEIKVRMNQKGELVNSKGELVAIEFAHNGANEKREFVIIILSKKDEIGTYHCYLAMESELLSHKEYEKIMGEIKVFIAQKFGSEIAELSDKYRRFREINPPKDKGEVAKILLEKLIPGISKKDIILLFGHSFSSRIHHTGQNYMIYGIDYSKRFDIYFEGDKYVEYRKSF